MSQNHEWYAVRARSNCETKIHWTLAEKGIENYLPSYREVHQNMEGLLVQVKNQTRLVLSITLLSQLVPAQIDASDLRVLRSTNEQVRRIARRAR